MKKYLFGLGAMIVGAGLTFMLMHGEVSAKVIGDDMADEEKAEMGEAGKSDMKCEHLVTKVRLIHISGPSTIFDEGKVIYCKIKGLTCVLGGVGTSCIRGSMF